MTQVPGAPLVSVGPRWAQPFERCSFIAGIITGVLRLLGDIVPSNAVAGALAGMAPAYYVVYIIGSGLGVWATCRFATDSYLLARRRLKTEISALGVCFLCLFIFAISAFDKNGSGGLQSAVFTLSFAGAALWRICQIIVDIRKLDAVVEQSEDT